MLETEIREQKENTKPKVQNKKNKKKYKEMPSNFLLQQIQIWPGMDLLL